MAELPTGGDDLRAHWQQVHESKPADGVSWWQSVPELSLGLVDRANLPTDAPVIDVGAGSSTLVDHLVAWGYSDVTLVDVSEAALAKVRERLGDAGARVLFEVADVLDLAARRRYRLWHDRAVFHFLTAVKERSAYREAMLRSLQPGGFAVVATFGPDGPETCSGLPTARYSHAQLAEQFPEFGVVAETGEEHHTPWGSSQQFTALLLRHAG